MKKFFQPEPIIFAYQGPGGATPPHSIISCEKSISDGADVLSLDIHLTSDKRLIAADGARLENVSNGKGEISSSTYDELMGLDAAYHFKINDEYSFRGKGIRFQTLDDFLAAFPDQRFNINIIGNDRGLSEAIADVILKTGSEDRVLASSNNFSMINRLRKKIPPLATALSMPEIITFYALFRTGLLFFKRRFSGDVLLIHEVLGMSYFGSSGLINAARKHGLKVYFLDVNDKKKFNRLKEAGADGFVTMDLSLFHDI